MPNRARSERGDLAARQLNGADDHEPGGGEAVDVCGDDQSHGKDDNHLSEKADGTADNVGVEVFEGD